MRGAGANRAGLDVARGGDPARRRLRPRHRQVRPGRLDHPVGDVHGRGHARRGHRQHRRAAPHQDLARARQMAPAGDQQAVVQLHRHGAHSRRGRGAAAPGGSTPSPGRRTTPRRSPACTTRDGAPSPSSTRRRPSPMRSGRPSRARSPTATPSCFWTVFGNPTRSSGRFRECFAGGRFAHRWHPRQIDSRAVSMTNKTQIATWVKDYGEDFGFRAGARPRRLPARRLDAVHRQRAHRRGGQPAADRRSHGGAGHGRRHRAPRRGPDRHPLPPRPRCALDPGAEVPHPRPHAGGEPHHGAGELAQSRCGVRRRHRHRLGRRRPAGPARLLQRDRHQFRRSRRAHGRRRSRGDATPTSGPRCGAS